MRTYILRRPTHPLTRMDPSPKITASSYPRSTTNSSGSGTRCSWHSRVIVLLNNSLGLKILSSSLTWCSTLCVHATINAMMHNMMAPPDRAGTPSEVDRTTRVIIVGIRDMICGITAVIVQVTKVIGTTVEILPLAVG